MKNLAPYLLNSLIFRMEDSGVQPHLVIKNGERVKFPSRFVSEQFLVFNVSSESVKNFQLDEVGVSFYARFDGKEFHVFAPLDCVMQLRSKDGQISMNLQVPGHTEEVTDAPAEAENSQEVPVVF